MNGTFYEQLGSVAGLFDQWGACERTVVACALVRRVPMPGLRLLQRAVDAALRDHGQDERLEREANDETFLAGLLAPRSDDDEDEGESLRQLLTLLPLLRTDNVCAKEVYVAAAPRLVQRCVDAPRRAAAELCRQLLSYLLVHPALTQSDQRTLTQWLQYLENHMSGTRTELVWQQRLEPTPDHNIWGSSAFRRTIGKNVDFRHITDPIELTFSTDLLQESFSKNGRDVDISSEGDKFNFDATIAQPKSQRSSSLTPPSTNFMHMSSSAENLTDEPFVQKPRSFSLSSEHSLGQIRPIIMYGTTGSETRLDDLRSNKGTEFPGMSTVAQWLKSLRLHKYVWLFTNISYEQMMAMDEEYLEKLGVTKGARHKLLLSISKLHERPAILEGVASELSGGVGAGAAARALERLRQLLLSPMPPDSTLPAQIVKVLETASTCIPESTCPPVRELPDDDEHQDPMSLHCWLVEKALHHGSFRAASLQAALRRLRHRLPPRTFYRHVGDQPPRRAPKPRYALQAALRRLRHRLPPRTFYRHVGDQPPRRASKPHWRAVPAYARALRGWQPPRPPPPPRPKSHSYPPFPVPRAAPSDDYSGLDALCLQMTEQAIN